MTPGRHVDGAREPDAAAGGPQDDGDGAARRPRHRAGPGAQARPAAPSSATDSSTVLPARSKDDQDAGWGDRSDGRDDDERFLRDVPPHW